MPLPTLTPREADIVCLFIRGYTYQATADRLGLRYESVKTYAARIREKLDVKTKVEVAVWGLKHLERVHGWAHPAQVES